MQDAVASRAFDANMMTDGGCSPLKFRGNISYDGLADPRDLTSKKSQKSPTPNKSKSKSPGPNSRNQSANRSQSNKKSILKTNIGKSPRADSMNG